MDQETYTARNVQNNTSGPNRFYTCCERAPTVARQGGGMCVFSHCSTPPFTNIMSVSVSRKRTDMSEERDVYSMLTEYRDEVLPL